MISALVLIVLVSAKDAETPETAALERSVRDALSAGSELQFRSSEPVDEAALAALTRDADAAAEVVWLDAGHRRAELRCYIKQWQRTVEREVTFKDDDQLTERGRLLGYTLAAMAPEVAPRPAPSAAELERATPPAPTSNAPEAPLRKPVLAAVELNALGSVGLGGPANGLGVSAAGRWYFVPALSLRLVAGVRRGSVPEVQADSQWAFAGVGFGFPLSQPGDGSRFSFGARVDFVAGSFSMRRRTSMGEPEHHERFSSTADLLAEGVYSPWSRTALKLGVGGEFAFGDTDVIVGTTHVTDIPQLRLVTELGLMTSF